MNDNSLLKELTIIIPAFNEGKNIKKFLEVIKGKYRYSDIIVIEDGSNDNTFEEISRVEGVTCIRHQINLGYGASIKNGVRAAKTRVVCWVDADGQHDPDDIIKVALPVLRKEVFACFGVRSKSRTQQLERIPGKYILSVISNHISGMKIPDINCGLRAFDRKVLARYLHLLPNKFSASLTTTLLLIKRGYNIQWVEIDNTPRIGTSSVKIVRDGINTLTIIFRIMILFAALRFFSYFSLLLGIAGLYWSGYTQFVIGKGISATGVGLLILAVLVFLLGVLLDQVAEMRKERFEIPESD